MNTEKINDYRSKYCLRALVVCIMVVIFASLMTTFDIYTVFAASEPTPKADTAIVMSGSTGEVVYGEHEERKLPMAGIAKIMVAMVAIDQMHDDGELKNVLQISTDVAKHGDMFNAGDKVSVKDLLYALIMNDSDEAAHALAIYSLGSDTAFVDKMNRKASEIGLLGTSYANVTGKYNVKQYSTAYDTALILRRAVANSNLQEILSAKSYEIEVTVKGENKPKKIKLTSESKVTATGLTVSGIYTDDRNGKKNMYYGLATDDGMDMIIVMFDSDKSRTDKDATTLFKYGFSKVTRKVIVKANKCVGKVKVRWGAVTRVDVYTKNKGYVYVPPEGSEDLIKTEVVLNKGVKAPLKAGDKVGEYKIYVADEFKGSVDLIVKDDVAKGWYPSAIYISNTMTVVIGIIIFCFFALRIRNGSLRRRRAKKRKKDRDKRIKEMARKRYEREEDRRRRNWTYR